MPRLTSVLLSVALGVVCATGLVACGSDDEGTIPPDVASAMISALDGARSAEANGDCAAVEAAATKVSNAAAGLGTDVDPQVREAIVDGAENLHALAQDPEKCASGTTGEEGQDTTDTSTTETSTTETSTTEATTTETKETKPPKPEPEPKPEPKPEPPPQQPGNEGGGLGQGDSGGTPPGLGNGGTGGGG
jgi:hypothetical protein